MTIIEVPKANRKLDCILDINDEPGIHQLICRMNCARIVCIDHAHIDIRILIARSSGLLMLLITQALKVIPHERSK